MTEPWSSARSIVVLACLLAHAPLFSSGQPRLPAGPDFSLNSPSFQPNGEIPARFSCGGADLSPAVIWTEPPAGAASFALIMDDPDAPGGVFTHWLIYDLPANLRQLPEGVRASAGPPGTRQGRNGFGREGYNGPCPPPGPTHRYFFRLYALDKMLNLPPGTSKDKLLRAMKGHVLAQAEVVGRFAR